MAKSDITKISDAADFGRVAVLLGGDDALMFSVPKLFSRQHRGFRPRDCGW